MDKPLSDMTLEELWRLFPIELSEHNPQWADWYMEEETALKNLLGEDIVQIDHIGSTSIRGLLAKPIVDILLQVADTSSRTLLKEKLFRSGWLLMAEDSAYGEMDFNKGYTPSGFAEKVYHLHIRKQGDWDELVFRDYLSSHPESLLEYAGLKRYLKEKYQYNRDAYTQAKTEFIRSCVVAAGESM